MILVRGTWENQKGNWAAYSPFLKNNGFCVFTFNYGGNPSDTTYGWKSIAARLRRPGQRTTGAAKVDIVGHSQGGMMPRYYQLQPAAIDQTIGSPFMQKPDLPQRAERRHLSG